ncbi:hypothetical protein H0I31_02170 [Tenacibaculum sp. AHE15PA]|uniref:hypothetical protein n=1 Tax=unclassified Tenacibaculum TaxID=2635139 RepID=UPI001C4E70D8|nr:MULTISPECIES: hypothetical protein [unclassified Tenacibaculum]QXP72528.1 hypothetical protein H0I30_07425 [Tenacibaculum sp. AHE14PA]QXP76443.1 hypothetical protein H0I31_02170 [Tenacibaculum sp. AHE15PA]
MVVLKKLLQQKVKASSLAEVLVASVLILIIFGIAVTALDTTLQSSVNKDTHQVETELYELQYLYKHGKIILPYNDETDDWLISVGKTTEEKQILVLFEATHKLSKKIILKKSKALEVN